ncbi:aldehyde dehydrogenase family protein [Burkholderia metallica]|uniref:aldehyde dehydrogenase family protein n=1 Tax=Burkholderia metallica TaxID=488729 RepID=UPI001F5BDB73|nr:aldehyde dehydrogenase family protein [Burkholderia metallica]
MENNLGSVECFQSSNPATGVEIGMVPNSTSDEVAQAVAAAKAAQSRNGWLARTASVEIM